MWIVSIILICQLLLISSSVIEEQSLMSPDSASTFENIALINIGTYRGLNDDGVEYQKTYFISRFSQLPWAESRSFCQSFNMDHLMLDTAAEAQAYLNLLNGAKGTAPNGYFWTDGMTVTPKSKTEWFWAKTGKKVSFPILWYPSEPNNGFDKDYEYCFMIFKHNANENFLFGDAVCNNKRNSACQKIDW